MGGFHGMDYDERVKPFAQQVALLDAKRMDQIRSLRQQLDDAVEALRDIVRHADMPAGESWERSYREVTERARAALRGQDT
jgi:hypothetical protein